MLLELRNAISEQKYTMYIAPKKESITCNQHWYLTEPPVSTFKGICVNIGTKAKLSFEKHGWHITAYFTHFILLLAHDKFITFMQY